MPEDEYTCEHCGASFDSENALRGHVNLQCDAIQNDGAEAMDDEEWIERAQQLRDELEEVVDADPVDDEGAEDSEQAHVREKQEEKREAHVDDVRDALPGDVAEKLPEGQELGSVKMLEGEDGPQMYIEIGGIMVPLQADFQISREAGHTVIEAIDPHDTDTVIRLDESSSVAPQENPAPTDDAVTEPEQETATERTIEEASSEAQDLDAFSAKQELIDEIATTYDIQAEQIEDRPLEDLRRLKRRLEERDDMKDELIHKYDVPEGDLVGKSLDELRDRKEDVKKANELRDDLEERFGIGLEGDRRLEELEDYEAELEQRREDALETLERFDIDIDPDEHSLDELEAKAEQAQTRDELIDEIVGYADYTREDLVETDIETLESLLDEKAEAEQLREDIQQEFETDEDLDGKELDELEDIYKRLKEAEELREHLTQFYDVEPEELQEKGLEELKELEDELEAIEDELHDVLGEHGIQTEEDKEAEQTESTAGEEGVSDAALDDMEFEEGEAPDPGEGTQELEKGKKLLDDLGLKDIKEHGSFEEDEEQEDVSEDEDDETIIDRITGLFAGATGDDASLEEATLSNMAQVEDIEEHHDATVLLAHTLKQFLELQLGIGRELTYMGIVDALQEHGEDIGLDDDDIERLVRFFKRMHLQTYKGGQRVDLGTSREMAEEYVRELS